MISGASVGIAAGVSRSRTIRRTHSDSGPLKSVTNTPDAPEILVERVKAQRFLAQSGTYDEVFQKYNDAMTAALS